MSIEDKGVIDFVSIDNEGNAILTITDHLEWDDENEHLLILQDKINSYLGVIETSELYDKYPGAINRNIIIRIIAMYSPNEDGQNFIQQVNQILGKAGYGFQFRVHSEDGN